MATANEVVTNALSLIGYLSDETPVEAADANRARIMLDRMLQSWEAGIVQLGYTKIVGGDDVLSVPDEALEAIEYSLAVRLSPVFSVPLDPLLIENQKEVFNNMLIAVKPKMTTQFPGNLPMGSGTEQGMVDTKRYFSNDGERNF